ncbi:hypothetical protein FHX37_1354 [Haloactinospora alba]|uniref:Uncharacterized protein n=1 Tax=Haloactinospora alba TaxID=405555 RepID=A0A543NI72_9ACTN|nr:HGxxPAAW family protein [Haloactinospora alba]TQN31450.1 hypothetical protein FHX37_1354 [Haloactinospora alba]
MADEQHEDHGNTVAAWFLTVTWIAAWSIAALAIILGKDFVLWTAVALGASVVCAVISGVMKKFGLGRTSPRPTPPMPEERKPDQRDAAGSAEDNRASAAAGSS